MVLECRRRRHRLGRAPEGFVLTGGGGAGGGCGVDVGRRTFFTTHPEPAADDSEDTVRQLPARPVQVGPQRQGLSPGAMRTIWRWLVHFELCEKPSGVAGSSRRWRCQSRRRPRCCVDATPAADGPVADHAGCANRGPVCGESAHCYRRRSGSPPRPVRPCDARSNVAPPGGVGLPTRYWSSTRGAAAEPTSTASDDTSPAVLRQRVALLEGERGLVG